MSSFNKYRQQIAYFSLAVVLLVLKSPDAISIPQFWAEDGPVFFASQFQRPWPLLLTPYAGYLHVVPRLVAWIASGFDLLYAPLIYNTLAILIDAFCIAFVSNRMAPFFSRRVVFLSFFVVPTAGDIFGTATNVQWFMQFALAAACLTSSVDTTTPRAIRFAGYVALALGALSGPFSVLIAGLAVGTIATTRLPVTSSGGRRFRHGGNVLLAIREVGTRLPTTNILILLACACVQTWILSTHEVRTPVEQFMMNAQQQAIFGVAGLQSFYSYTVNHPFVTAQLLELVLMAVVTLACLAHTWRHPGLWTGVACLLLALGGAQPVLAYMKQHEVHTLAATSHYFYMLSVVSCWISWRLLSLYRPAWRTSALTIAGGAFVAGIVLRPDYFRREPLHDLGWTRYAAELHGDDPLAAIVPVNPAPWYFKLHKK